MKERNERKKEINENSENYKWQEKLATIWMQLRGSREKIISEIGYGAQNRVHMCRYIAIGNEIGVILRKFKSLTRLSSIEGIL
jgi:hypothetical protein